MAKRFDAKARKEGLERSRADEGGGAIWVLGNNGNPLNGTGSSDFLLAQQAGTVNGLGGDDLILGDIGGFDRSEPLNVSFANADDLDSVTSIWSIQENPLFADGSIPHATLYVEGNDAQQYFMIVVGAGQTLTVDIDGAGGMLGSGADTNATVQLYVASDLVTAVSTDTSSSLTDGGFGSASTFDPFLVFTNMGGAATYYIRIFESGGDGNFETDDEFLLNVSLTGHAVGAGLAQDNDTVNGGTGDDHLFGAGGNDSLNGGTGADLMAGGIGDDSYLVDDAGDRVAENPGEGNDTVTASTSYALATDASVEVLQTQNQASATPLDLTGSSIGQTINGNAGVNLLRGEGGNDTIYGFGGIDFLVGGAGSDIMVGGTGDDTYYIDDTSDAITELAAEGNDRIAASITLALAPDANIERIEAVNLAATNAMDLTGSDIANIIYGNDGLNILRGQGGNDELRGFGGNDFLVGGAGTDLMVGGAGDDTFYVDDASDAIGELNGEGNDRIAASVSFVLSNGANVEVLEAVNVTATAAFDLTGSDSANTITGNNGVNILRGEGGADTLSGAGGDDFLVGGASSDNMAGGAGNDTFYVDSSGDEVIEAAGEGTNDRVVVSSLFYVLAPTTDIERLEAATQSATDAINLYGNDLANIILGNNGANDLQGRGGNDILTGFGAADNFGFFTALAITGVDTITDLVSATDRIHLAGTIFQGMAPGALGASQFRVDSAAQDADDRILYNSQTGQLYYDADGNGAFAAVQFALLQGAPALVASDILVIF